MESVLSFYLPPCLILLSQHPNADLDSGNCCFMLTTISIDRGINRVAFSVIFSYLGLLTMDLRFGDVIDDAARYFKDAYNRNLAPYKFVEGMIDRTIEKLWPNNPMLACDSSCQSRAITDTQRRFHFPVSVSSLQER
ncbi:ATP-citrate synthase beta chain protein 1 isoform X2 [Helianthus annuus]|uniref:ATP-citrate synthase beta chain protein 1 isoform X2 n=1 Tax=Helianthus annuus TaxID=4232 RepID=UPI0016531A9D|nr:ATP-citrate synthase beta chain protein 1 isoform X2 [Helianthus annuus]